MFKYYAFISYSNKDKEWGEWLIHELETYVLPASIREQHQDLPERLYPIFRDCDELAAETSLSQAIQKALTESKALIVICSPHSVQSKWVHDEIAFFKSLGRTHNIFGLIVSGSPHAAKEDEECFPLELKNISSHDDILAPDIRKEADGKHDALLKLIVGLLRIDFDINFDELKKRDQYRNKQWNYFTCIEQAKSFLSRGAYKKAEQELLSLAHEEKDFDFRHWEWDHLALQCNLDIMTLRPPSRGISSVFFSKDAQYTIMGGYDGTMIMWDFFSGNEKLTIKAHSKKINSIDFDPSSQTILTAGTDRLVKLWDANTGHLLQTFHKKPDVPVSYRSSEVFWDFVLQDKVISAAIFDRKHHHVIATTGVTVTIWNSDSGHIVNVLWGNDDLIKSVALSNDDTWIVATSDENIYVWSHETGKLFKTFKVNDSDFIIGVTDAHVLLAKDKNLLSIRNLLNDEEHPEEHVIHLKKRVLNIHDIAFSPDKSYVITGGEPDCKIWDLTTSERHLSHPYFVLKGNDSEVSSVAVGGDSDRKYFLTASTDGIVKLWNTNLSVVSHRLTIPGNTLGTAINNAIFTPDGQNILLSCIDGRMFMCGFDNVTFSHEFLFQKKCFMQTYFKFSPCAKYIIVASDGDPWIDIWSLEDRKIVKQFYIRNERVSRLPNVDSNFTQILLHEGGRCSCLEVNHTGAIIAGCADGTVRIFHLYQDIDEICFQAHQNDVKFVALSTVSHDCFLTNSNNGTVKFWSISQNTLFESWKVTSQEILCGMLTAEDKNFIIGCADGSLSVFDIAKKKETFTLNAHLKAITGLVISPDGKRIITGSEDGMVKVFCTHPLKELLMLPHDTPIGAIPIGFSSNMRYLCTINARSELVLWDSIHERVHSKQEINIWKRQRYTEYRKR